MPLRQEAPDLKSTDKQMDNTGNILILNDKDPYGLGASYMRGFTALGRKAELRDPYEALERGVLWRNRVLRRLFEPLILRIFNTQYLKEIVASKAELIWVGKGAWALPQFWRELRNARPDLKLVCYNPDNPIHTFSRGGNRPWVTESIPLYDLYCTYNQSLLSPLKDAGAKQTLWVPFAWDPEVHSLSSRANHEVSESDVVFIGNADRHRAETLESIISHLNKSGLRFDVYGDWSGFLSPAIRKCWKGMQVYGDRMVKVVSTARIAINILRIQNHGSHNMRTFEIPGCGGVMCSNYSQEQTSFLPEGECALYFKDATQAATQLCQAIAQPAKLEEMRERSSSTVQSHLYQHRCEAILKNIGEMRAS